MSENSIEQSAVRKFAIRLVPFLALMFFINYLDRTAISFAGPNGMNQDLGLSAAQFGFASGIFFLGYIILEVPSNLALHKFGAHVSGLPELWSRGESLRCSLPGSRLQQVFTFFDFFSASMPWRSFFLLSLLDLRRNMARSSVSMRRA